MRKTVLFIAVSLDGCIAGPKGELDWLSIAEGDKYGYEAFDRSVDTTIMAGRTYRDVLGFGMPVYPDKTNYILTRKKKKNEPENFIFFKDSVAGLVKKLKRRKGKDIFIVGGSGVIYPLIESNLIDEYRIFTLPIMLGAGVPLFPKQKKRLRLTLTKMKKYPSGMVECCYTKL